MIYSLEQLKSKILDAIKDYPHSFTRMLKSDHYDPGILNSLDFYLPKLANQEYTVQTKIYWLMNGIEDFPKCGNPKCTNTFEHKNVIDWRRGYHKNCCPQCAKDSDERKMLCSKACMERYGVENISQLESTKQKKAQKALAKYGVDNVAKAQEVQDAIKATNIARYGASLYINSAEGIEYRKLHCMQKYGVESYTQTHEHIEKCKEANRKNYSVDWPQQSRDFMCNVKKRYAYNNIHFDSAPELAYYIWLNDNNVQFTYQPGIVFHYLHNGILHTYEPDFIVEGQVVEIKGDHFFKEDGTMQNPYDHSLDALYEAKRQCMVENNVKILRSADYAKYMQYVVDVHGEGYLKSFKQF